jgi:hypothetical protein
MEIDATQDIQDKVDRLKLINLTDNVRNLIPPQQRNEDPSRDIALVNVLSVSPRIKEKFLELRGLEYDPSKKELIQITTPIMNLEGAYRFVKVLKMAEEIEWSSYSEEEINKRIIHYFQSNIPYYLFYHEDYELRPQDFGYIITTLQVFIDTSFHKSKQGKYINTLGRTYGEDFLSKAFSPPTKDTSKEEGLSRYNPFKKW